MVHVLCFRELHVNNDGSNWKGSPLPAAGQNLAAPASGSDIDVMKFPGFLGIMAEIIDIPVKGINKFDTIYGCNILLLDIQFLSLLHAARYFVDRLEHIAYERYPVRRGARRRE